MNIFPRVLVVFLLIVNGAFYYIYAVHKPAAVKPAASRTQAGVERLVLLSEKGASTTDTPAASQGSEAAQDADATDVADADDAAAGAAAEPIDKPPVTQSPADLQACYTLGPMPDEKQAKDHEQTLDGEGYQVEVRSSPSQVQRGYWVMLPPFLSRESANKALGKLKSDGFDDVALLTDGEFENAISVGLFTNRDTALNQQKKLLEKNYQTVIRDRHVTRTDYWLDITGPQQALAARLEALAGSGEPLGIASCRSGQISGRE